jgi:hypothetical protein
LRLIPKNWREFQHYKDRSPPWIRLHRKLLDNRDFNALPPMACKVLVLLWLLASEETDGVFDANAEDIAFRLRMPSKDVAQALPVLMEKGFLQPADERTDEQDGRPLSQLIAERNGFGSRHISDKVKRSVWVRDGGKCCHCGSADDIEYDHKVPVSAGGGAEEANIWLLCRPCNRKKRTKTAEQFATPAQPKAKNAYPEALQRQSITEAEDSAEPQADSPPPFICLPLVDGSEHPVAEALVAEWTLAFPAVNVRQQLREMRQWCIANRANRKTARGIDAFINRWLGREQDKDAGRKPNGKAAPTETTPTNPAALYVPPAPLTAEERAAADAVRLQVMSAVKRVA